MSQHTSNRWLVDKAIEELQKNLEQYAAVHERNHCVVIAGPGSGKTKTLTTAIARTLLDDVAPPRGIACITYNNECAIELETRLARLGIEPSERVYIGTVHSFALSQIVSPYARCVLPELPEKFRIATRAEQNQAIEEAHKVVIGTEEDPYDRWKFAEEKRKKDVDRTNPNWKGRNPELAEFIEGYEAQLRSRDLIDFEDMPLLGFRMTQAHEWIRRSLLARFPVIFVDEYQDLGHALHELVLMLCFGAGVRLFAVGDPDQSIYRFTGAEPELLQQLIDREDVRTIRLRFNYRCMNRINEVSMAALGEDRSYETPEGTADGTVLFNGIVGDLDAQASFVIKNLLPEITTRGVLLEEIAILYRWAKHGDAVAAVAIAEGIPIVRADNQALVRRNSRLSRFIEACAQWVVGGWRDANPPFQRLAAEAVALVLGSGASHQECWTLKVELMLFLQASLGCELTANAWLRTFRDSVLTGWQRRARALTDEWDAIDDMIRRTGPSSGNRDMSLSHFAGRIVGSGRLNLSTLHSAKGREFDAVILFAMNDDVFPTWGDKKSNKNLREARRLFYVGVTRARHELYLIFQKEHHSPWLVPLYEKSKTT